MSDMSDWRDTALWMANTIASPMAKQYGLTVRVDWAGSELRIDFELNGGVTCEALIPSDALLAVFDDGDALSDDGDALSELIASRCDETLRRQHGDPPIEN